MSDYPCPKCGRQLPQAGDVAVDGKPIPVYQCDQCLIETDVMGKRLELPLTFALGDDGKPFDPANPDGRLSL